MTKLTNWMREGIVKAALRHRFASAAATLVADRASFAQEVYADLYSAADRRKMAALPAGWLPEEDHIHVQFGDGRGYEQVSFSGAIYGSITKMLEDPIERVFHRAQYQHRNGCAKVYEPHHPLVVRHAELKARAKDLENQIDVAQRQTEAAIASASTVNRLTELWPEIAPFAAMYSDQPRAPVPALPTAQLNAMLGLPVEEAA